MVMREKLAVIVLTMFALSVSVAGEGAGGTEKRWFEKATFQGDLRLRYEGFDQSGKFDESRRDRFRYRFRWGFRAKVNELITIGLQLRSGDARDPVSDNQTLTSGLDKKEIAIAEAFADFTLTDELSLIAGKFSPKKLWTVSDMQYDDDVVTEGAMARWKHAGGHGLLESLQGVLFVQVLEESKNGSDSYAWGAQFSPTLRIGKESRLQLGVGFDTLIEPQGVVDLTLSGKLKGNKVSNFLDGEGQLVSDFDVVSVFGIYRCRANKSWPLKLTAFFYRNSGATGVGEDYDTAYFGRIQVGDYKKPGQMAFRVSVYHSEPDALFYAYTQSDTTRGSNLDGLRFDYRVGLHSRGYLNFTWYNTDPELGEGATMNRWQLDYILKF